MLDGIRNRFSTSDDETEPAHSADVTVDGVLDVLSNARRRYVIDYLATHDGEVTLREVSEYVTAIETGTKPERIDTDARQSVYITLYQNHIPALAEAGYIEHTDPQNILEANAETHAVASALESVRQEINGGDS